MSSQIYINSLIRRLHKKQIDEFLWPFVNKILLQFNDIEDEADRVREEIWDQLLARANPEFSDPGDFVDDAIDAGIQHYDMLRLGLYTVTVSWHATLYEFYFQQMRLFLYREMSFYYTVSFNSFCEGYRTVPELFLEHGYDMSTATNWCKIEELRLLCNVIKHGDGRSADELRRTRPDLFLDSDQTDLTELYKTTLLETTLQLNSLTLNEYAEAIKGLWDELPERSISP